MAVIFLIASGCKTTPPKEEAPVEEPAPVEINGLTLHPVNGIGDLQVYSSAPGEATKTGDNSWLIQIPLGAMSTGDDAAQEQVLMKCSYIKGNDSPVYILKDFLEKIKANPDVQNFEVSKFSVGVMGKTPMISSQARYNYSNKVAGYIESASLSTLGFVIFCYIEEEGFSESFSTSVKSISESKLVDDLQKRIKNYNRREIYSVKLNDNVIGYSENYVFNGSKEDINYYMLSNYFINMADKRIFVGEIIEDIFAEGKTGHVTSAKYYSSQNNTREYKLDLNETAPGKYTVKGTYKDAAFEKTLQTDKKSRVTSVDYLIDKTSKGPKSIAGKIIKLVQFHASHPEQLVESEIIVNELDSGIGKFRYKSGSVILDYETDIPGVSKISMENEKIKMVWVRIYSE